MKLRKKVLFIFVWFIVLGVLINILYGVFYNNDLGTLKDFIVFNFKYHTRKIEESTIEYSEFSKENSNNVISKNNISIELLNMEYVETTGDLNLSFEFYTNDNKSFVENMGFLLKIYDGENIFYNETLGNYTSDNETFLKKVDKNLKTDYLYKNIIENMSFSSNSKNAILDIKMNLGENYKINEDLNISIIDYMYRTTEEYLQHRAIEPMGEFKFIIDF